MTANTSTENKDSLNVDSLPTEERVSHQLEVAKHYDEVWQENPGESWDTWPFYQAKGSALKYALNRLGNLENKAVLDLGCGIGYTPLELAKRGAQVTAVDLSETAVQSTQRRVEAAGYSHQVCTVRANVEQLPFADASFDVIYAQNFLMHVSHRAVGRECYRLLKPGGKLVVVEPLAHHPLIRLYRRFFSDYKGTHPRYSTHEDMATLAYFFNHGYEKRFYLSAALAAFWQNQPVLLKLALPLLNALDAQLRKIYPASYDWYWVTVLELFK